MSLAVELERLAELHRRGVLSDAEFERAKELVLSERPQSSEVVDLSGLLDRLRRSTVDRQFGGVCGGIAETTGIPSWFSRAVFIVLGLVLGLGAAIYVALWQLIPLNLDDPNDHPGIAGSQGV